ncbi:MAG TPA: hypothetical protein VFH45_05365, partial [Acidimicrobiales bacterium]|nr:hypothetical protein [Acidimicrobiales bacterium]
MSARAAGAAGRGGGIRRRLSVLAVAGAAVVGAVLPAVRAPARAQGLAGRVAADAPAQARSEQVGPSGQFFRETSLVATPGGLAVTFMEIPPSDRPLGRRLWACLALPLGGWSCQRLPTGGSVDAADPWMAWSTASCPDLRGLVIAALASWPGASPRPVLYHLTPFGWEGPVLLPDWYPDPADGPKAVSSGDELYLAYRSYSGSTQYLASSDGCSWSEPVPLSGGQDHPRLSDGPAGAAAVVGTTPGQLLAFDLVDGMRPEGTSVAGTSGAPFPDGPDGLESDVGRTLVRAGGGYYLAYRDPAGGLDLT